MSWQIVPKVSRELLGDPDSDKTERAMKTLLQMKKIDIQKIKRAYDGH
jgi:predicted 3-demethylubiquinone-9 3-methyltransferase (glyoxalase superfamily)